MVPFELPVKLATQVAEFEFPLSVQLVLVGETPAPLAVKLTVPVIVLFPLPVPLSATATVQLLVSPMATGLAQLTLVVVGRTTVIDAVPLLAACPVAPLPSPG
jgi:hypothetical protein